MISVYRTNSENNSFLTLVRELDKELEISDGEDHCFYDQFNKLDTIKHVVLLYKDQMAVGCGAIKNFEEGKMELKRMFVLPEKRGEGLASIILQELEKWALEMSFRSCVLETGINQPEAISLYKKNGYRSIPNYGQYSGLKTSLCFEKNLINT